MIPTGSSIVAVYPDHDSAEQAIRLLHKEGFAIEDLSIIGRNSVVTEEPTGFITTGDYVSAGARSGAFFGGIAGVVIGAAVLILPGVGPIIVAGPLAAACSRESKARSPAWLSVHSAAHSSAGEFPRIKR